MKKLSGFVSFLCILNVLALLGLGGFLFGTGRLDKAKAQVITDILRTKSTPAEFRTKVYDLMSLEVATQAAAATATKPATEETATDFPATAAERNLYVRKAVETERLRLEAQAQELRNQQEMLTRMQGELAASAEKAEAQKRAFQAQVVADTKQKNEAAFQKMMALFEELKPKQIKELLITMPLEEAAKYMAAMEAEKTAKIISEFKSADEKARLTGILEGMRGGVVGSGTGAASEGTAALSAAAPAAKAVP